MAKTTTPILSFKAHGSLANTMTFQKKGSTTLVRAKPIPTNRGSLAQCYQRWLYQDYMYRFTQLTPAQKAALKKTATPKNWTPLAEYLFTKLTPRTNLLGWWRMDEQSGTTAYDTSPYKHNGTVFGATIDTGAISKCRYFDGTDDRIILGSQPEFGGLVNLTLEALVYLTEPPDTGKRYTIFERAEAPNYNDIFLMVTDDLSVLFCVKNTNYCISTPITLNTWHHLAGVFKATDYSRLYIDGELRASTGAVASSTAGAFETQIGESPWYALGDTKGYIDNVVLWDTTITQIELQNHSKRRHA